MKIFLRLERRNVKEETEKKHRVLFRRNILVNILTNKTHWRLFSKVQQWSYTWEFVV